MIYLNFRKYKKWQIADKTSAANATTFEILSDDKPYQV